MKTRITVALFLGWAWLFAAAFSSQGQTPAPSTTQETRPAAVDFHFGKVKLTAEIADTPARRERGLMYRQTLGDNDGMIFLMPEIGPVTFWMKNTLIPLSVAFLDRNGVILEIRDMKPLDETAVRSASNQVAYVLEMNLHWFVLNGIKPGDKITPAPGTLFPASPS